GNAGELNSLLSFFAQWYLNPEYNGGFYVGSPAHKNFISLPFLTGVVPGPLENIADDLICNASTALGNAFLLLPDATAGDDLMFDALYNTPVGRLMLPWQRPPPVPSTR